MTRKEIEALNNTVITEDQFEEIELHEDVDNMDNCGNNSQYPGTTWYSVEFSDGESIDVFFKMGD